VGLIIKFRIELLQDERIYSISAYWLLLAFIDVLKKGTPLRQAAHKP